MSKFLISDCDYTLIDFNHEGGIAALRNHPDHGALAEVFDGYFNIILKGTRTEGGDEFIKLKTLLEDLSDRIVAGDEKLLDAAWSRELWAYSYLQKMSAKDPVRRSLEAATIYWDGVGRDSRIYEDVPLFIEKLRENEFNIVFVTSSDGRLVSDEDFNGFKYIPNEAKRFKKSRYEICGFDKIADLDNNLFIGDPIAKPHRRFWQQTLHEADIDSSNDFVVVIGDSHDTDLQGAKWFKTKSILLDRNKKYDKDNKLAAADHIAYNLKEALKFIV